MRPPCLCSCRFPLCLRPVVDVYKMGSRYVQDASPATSGRQIGSASPTAGSLDVPEGTPESKPPGSIAMDSPARGCRGICR